MKPKLLLITRNYPYRSNGGETMFIKPEIPHLVKYFDVTVAPVYAEGELVENPASIIVDKSLSDYFNKERKGINKVLLAFRAFSSATFYREIYRSILHGKFPQLVRILGYCVFFITVYDWLKHKKHYHNYDLYYTYWSDAATSGIVKFFEEKEKTIITRVHGRDIYHERQGGYIPGCEYNFSGVSKIVTISKHGKNYLTSQGISYSKIMLSRLGVEERQVNSEMGTGDDFNVLSCSFVKPLKRVYAIYEALTKVANNQPVINIKWTHLGGGRLLTDLKNKVKSDCPENLNCTFTGYLPNDEVIKFYKKNPVDLFVHASETEGLPVSMQEALSFGVPIISTNVGGVSEIVVPEVGKLVEAENPSDNLAEAILDFLTYDKYIMKEIRKSAKNRQRKLFLSDKNHATFAKSLYQLVK